MTSFKHVKSEFTSDEGQVKQGLFIDEWMRLGARARARARARSRSLHGRRSSY
jgi:hypothetical protein